MHLRKVDLPEPDEPMMAITSRTCDYIQDKLKKGELA